MNPFAHGLLLVVPIVFSGVVHQVVRANDWLPRAGRSLDELLFRGRQVFGRNKTLRGFVVVPIACATAFACESAWSECWSNALGSYPALTGWLVGLSSMAAELPNSFLKRRLKIAPGAPATRVRALFFCLDHVDSALGCALVLRTLGFPWRVVGAGLLLGPPIHVGVNLASYVLRLRNAPC